MWFSHCVDFEKNIILKAFFPLLALIATASSVSIAFSLGPITTRATKWNQCYDGGFAWLANQPWQGWGDANSNAVNYCNGGTPSKPSP